MRRRARRADELDAARRLLGSAEREALDEVVAIRAEATQMLEAARQEAARLRAEAVDERAAIDAVRQELQTLRDDLDERPRAGAGDHSQHAGPSPSAARLLASTQADLATLVQLLDGLASRAGSADLDHSETGGER